MGTTSMVRGHGETNRWVRQGLIGGLIAGLIFAMFEMVVAALINGASAFFMPLRMIGAMVLGAEALDPGYSLITAGPAGVLVHVVLSALFGAVFGAVVAAVPAVARSTGALVAAAGLYGLLLWLVNFYVVAPAAGWDWFPNGTDEAVQVVAHVVCFGALLGFYLDREARPTRS